MLAWTYRKRTLISSAASVLLLYRFLHKRNDFCIEFELRMLPYHVGSLFIMREKEKEKSNKKKIYI